MPLLRVGPIQIAVRPSRQFGRMLLRRAEAVHRRVQPRPAAAHVANGAETPGRRAILDRIRGIEWYHTLALGEGVVTRGYFDHTPYLAQYQLPERLDGMRVLDVATFDGYWAFEFERRGAKEVVALDIGRWRDGDVPPAIRAVTPPEVLDQRTGAGFEAARELLGSKVRREICNVYDLTPERLGMFDMVFCGDLLLHLSNPIKAVQNIRSVTSGFAIIADCFNPSLFDDTVGYCSGLEKNVWWSFSFGALQRMIADAGFAQVELLSRFKLPPTAEMRTVWHAVFKATPPH